MFTAGEDPISAHNRYPSLWAEVNREFVEESKAKQQGKPRKVQTAKEVPDEEQLVFFMRAGFRETPKWATLFWEGDQMTSWQRNDGIKSAIVGLLSSCLSGFSLNHSDIGGYCAVDLPFSPYRRSEEVLLRWMEMNSFTTIFRTHEVIPIALFCIMQLYCGDVHSRLIPHDFSYLPTYL